MDYRSNSNLRRPDRYLLNAPPPQDCDNSLISRERTGNNCREGVIGVQFDTENWRNLWGVGLNSLRKGTGNFLAVSGKDANGTA